MGLLDGGIPAGSLGQFGSVKLWNVAIRIVQCYAAEDGVGIGKTVVDAAVVIILVGHVRIAESVIRPIGVERVPVRQRIGLQIRFRIGGYGKLTNSAWQHRTPT